MFQSVPATLLLIWWTCSSPGAPAAPEAPWSCSARCGVFQPEAGCQCNEACVAFGDCCPDLCGVCATSTPIACDCVPCCQGRLCGSDGCGGSCGACPGTSRCIDGGCLVKQVVCGAPHGRTFLQPPEAERLERWAPEELPSALVALAERHLDEGGLNPCDAECPIPLHLLGAEAWLGPEGILLARLHLAQSNPSGGGWRAEVISRPPWTEVLGYGFHPGPEVAHEQQTPWEEPGVLSGLEEEAMRLAPSSAEVVDVAVSVVWRGCRITGYQVAYVLAVDGRRPATHRIRFHLDARKRLVSVQTW